VDINPWAARTAQPEYPDYIWIDLDPTVSKKGDEDRGFAMAIEVATAAREVIDAQAESVCKDIGQDRPPYLYPVRGHHLPPQPGSCHGPRGTDPRLGTENQHRK